MSERLAGVGAPAPGDDVGSRADAADDGGGVLATTASPGDSIQLTAPGPPISRRQRSRRVASSWLIVIVVAGALAVGLRLFVLQTFYVPSASMEPTLQVGDRMLVLKIGYTIDRGSILVFRQPPNDTSDTTHEDLVKRVIGLPGETIWSEGNTVYIDGKPLAEPWLPTGTALGPPPIRKQTIPRGDYFMMGDNRTDSFDSRDWGVLPRGLVVGEVLVVIWRHGWPVFHIQ
jgi:signal peptidase I